MMKRIAIVLLLFSTFLLAASLRAEEKATPRKVTESTEKEYSKPATTSMSKSVTGETASEKSQQPEATSSLEATNEAVSELKLPEKEEKGPTYKISGYYRARYLGLWDVSMGVSNNADLVNAAVNENKPIPKDDVNVFYHKLVLEPSLKLNKYITFNFQINVFNDHPYGLPSGEGNLLSMDTSDRTPNVILKRAYGLILLPIGLIEFGRVPSNFGLGMSDNDGNAPDELFGDAHYGDTFDRILFATKPLGPKSDLVMALLADKLVEGLTAFDDLIQPEDGECESIICNNLDDVNQTGIVLIYNMGSGESDDAEYQGPIIIGNNFTYRWQDSTSSKVYSNDFFLKVNLGLLYTNFESVMLKGETQALPSLAGDKVIYPDVTIDSSGWVWNMGLNTDQYRFHFEVGYASGDVPGSAITPGIDETFSQFSFHPDYNVGMIMFEYALDAFNRDFALTQKANLQTLLNNGLISEDTYNEMVKALPLLLSHGAVSNALYVNPRFTYKLFDEKLKVTLAYLYAKANSPRVIKRQGKEPIEGDEYGNEIDLGIKYVYKKNVIFGLEGGMFFPGNYFTSVADSTTGVQTISPDNVYALQGKITIVFGKYASEDEY